MASKNAWARSAWRKRPFFFFFRILPCMFKMKGWYGVRVCLGIFLGVYK